MHIYEVRHAADTSDVGPVTTSMYYSNLKKAYEFRQAHLLYLSKGQVMLGGDSYSTVARYIKQTNHYSKTYRTEAGLSGRLSIHKIQIY